MTMLAEVSGMLWWLRGAVLALVWLYLGGTLLHLAGRSIAGIPRARSWKLSIETHAIAGAFSMTILLGIFTIVYVVCRAGGLKFSPGWTACAALAASIPAQLWVVRKYLQTTIVRALVAWAVALCYIPVLLAVRTGLAALTHRLV